MAHETASPSLARAQRAARDIMQRLAPVSCSLCLPDLARQVLTTLLDVVTTWDYDGRVTLWAPHMADLTGIEAQDAVERPVWEMFPPARDLWARLLAGQPVLEESARYVAPDGVRRALYDAAWLPMTDEGLVIGGAVCVFPHDLYVRVGA